MEYIGQKKNQFEENKILTPKLASENSFKKC